MIKAKKVDLEQGSQKWLSWRRCHLTASNTAALLNLSPWDTPYSVYQEMANGVEKPSNEAMARGRELEPVARAKIESLISDKLEPGVFESLERPWMGASLDAVNADFSKGYEIKVTGSKQIDNVKKGEIPEYYRIQCLKQMLVMGWKMMWLFFYENDENWLLVPVERDEKMIEEIIAVETEFWKEHIIPGIAPPLSFRDWEVRDNAFENEIAIQWLEAKEAEETAGKKKKELEELLKGFAKGKSVNYIKAGVKVHQISRDGNIDWEAVCLRWKIDKKELEKYRKEKVSYVKISGQG